MATKQSDKKRPQLDQLESGPWPSFITDLKQLAERKESVDQVLDQLEESYQNRWNYWQGTVITVDGYGGGIIARLSDLSDKYPAIKEFHTVRVIEPSGFVYSTDALRNLCDISEKHSAGILQLHGMTGDILIAKLHEIRPDLPVILCTGYSKTMTLEKARAVGAREFILKPILSRDLGLSIRRALDRRKSSRREQDKRL